MAFGKKILSIYMYDIMAIGKLNGMETVISVIKAMILILPTKRGARHHEIMTIALSKLGGPQNI